MEHQSDRISDEIQLTLLAREWMDGFYALLLSNADDAMLTFALQVLECVKHRA